MATPPPPRSVSNLSPTAETEQPPASPKTQQQQMKEKLRERYRLQPDSNQAPYSPRQEHVQQYQDVAAEHLVENPVGDPEMAKWKSSLWRRAGQVQAALGDLSGIESWQSQGRTTEAYADQAYNEAESRQRLGEASWINGEYNVLMGRLTNAVGYVAGDPEMQAKAQLRAREGQEEIEKLKR
ncbi:hypothetical protein BDB00DRAFT_849840 [Zychaea mexicana]|uniref:uncharacterized protein n=1 Tax=Zychaea mexicana TaxID=64656 RepID=UPI0022FE2CD0|nr:uncharacterized protein BDB00DRAFT_849840 [Zychaea mexicana]KAI9488148.1 hypothetical protein BDB00DRAFT_849840 [Zychaea mexicana]